MSKKRIKENKQLKKRFYVEHSSIHGKGVFARKRFVRGDYLGTYHGPVVTENGTYVLWVETDDDDWLMRDGKNVLRYLNHSKKPNTEFDGFDLYAKKTIRPDDELTFDYGEEP